MDLRTKKCKPCEKGAPPFTEAQEDAMVKDIENWEIVRTGIHKIKKLFRLKGFSPAMGFVVQIGLVAQEQGHHPDIHVYYDRVEVEFYTHAVGGLSENDFIMAAKIDDLLR